ncbi:MAG: GIY-YIG nuclease family protein [Candidatus Omnitrophica bacterium]|nr:GIY-YIG nuclease family protein [Candidatus Omnitrophota bacterium]
MYYIYVLKNNNGKHYLGSCENLEVRLERHNQNSVRSTKNKGPFKLIYKEEFSTRTEARKRESCIKKHKSIKYFLKQIENNLTLSSSLV